MTEHKVCSAGKAWGLDNTVRKWFQNPEKMLKSFVKEGMTVLDVGCGPGFFTIEMARLVGKSGKVIAADLQEKMLEKLIKKVQGKEIQSIIKTHKTEAEKIGVNEQVDFALAFYMVHEVPSQKNFFEELHKIIKPNGKMLLVEPKFHVSENEFEKTVQNAKNAGLNPIEKTNGFLSRGVVLQN